MEYMLLIYDDEEIWAAMPASERKGIVQEYFAWAARIPAARCGSIDAHPVQPVPAPGA